jgi:hypothetical protein
MSEADDFDDLLQEKLKILREKNAAPHVPKSENGAKFSNTSDCVDFYGWYQEEIPGAAKNVFVFHKKFAAFHRAPPESPDEGAKPLFPTDPPLRPLFDTETLLCWELFNRNGAELPADFDLRSLKKAWHRVALKVHPDTSELPATEAKELFVAAERAFRVLEQFKKAA